MPVADVTDIAWKTVLPAALAEQTAVIVGEVTARLADPVQVQSAVATALGQTGYPNGVRWTGHDVAQGDAGLALLCGQLDRCFPQHGWDSVAHDYLSRAAASVARRPRARPSLFGGLSGLAFTTWSLARGETRYRRLLRTLDDSLVQTISPHLAERWSAHGMPVSDFDAITGLAGITTYLLCRREQASVRPTLDAAVTRLVALSEESNGMPRWHTPPSAMVEGESMARQFPEGYLNCGLAHGIPGPLAALSLALRAGVEVSGQRDAVERIAVWLVDHRVDDRWGVNWPSGVALAPSPDHSVPGRSAWCYGSPGVARSLWLAGQALEDADLCELAVVAMEAIYRRPLSERAIDSAGLCHGVAGLLQITLRFAHDTGASVFTAAATELTEQLIALYSPERPVGFCSLEPGAVRVDHPGLLDGAAGVALVLMAASSDVAPVWDRLFLLS